MGILKRQGVTVAFEIQAQVLLWRELVSQPFQATSCPLRFF